jgi:type I restriction-modification system DNA methylase subunit
MDLAIHGLDGDVREANTYYEDLHQSTGQFDFVLANPPFNVNAVDKERLTGDAGKNSARRTGFAGSLRRAIRSSAERAARGRRAEKSLMN